MKKEKVKIKQVIQAEDVAKVLTDLAASVTDGKVCLEKGDNFVVLETSEDTHFELELEAGTKKNKRKFKMELSWRVAPPIDEEADPVKISSDEPEVEESELEPESEEIVE